MGFYGRSTPALGLPQTNLPYHKEYASIHACSLSWIYNLPIHISKIYTTHTVSSLQIKCLNVCAQCGRQPKWNANKLLWELPPKLKIKEWVVLPILLLPANFHVIFIMTDFSWCAQSTLRTLFSNKIRTTLAWSWNTKESGLHKALFGNRANMWSCHQWPLPPLPSL